ncbi:MAG: hypothetical protein E6J26_00900 [Chloroflexi bacterium]|nr:MAG: hypothetical protein E6J26_00900 [Chloroflexota bacterium]
MPELYVAVLTGWIAVLVIRATLSALDQWLPAWVALVVSRIVRRVLLLSGCAVLVILVGQLMPVLAEALPDATRQPEVTPLSSAEQPQPTPVRVVASQSIPTRPRAPTQPAAIPSPPLTNLKRFPRPPGDNGRGLHWFPTTSQSPGVVDRFVPELVAMRIKWVAFAQGMEDYHLHANEYLVRALVQNNIMPVMRVESPVGALDLVRFERVVALYRALGVMYIQIYNEPNLSKEWSDRKLGSPERFAAVWLEAAEIVVSHNAWPGLAAMSPQGEQSDDEYVARMFAALRTRKGTEVINRMWLSVHNYTGGTTGSIVADEIGYGRYRLYAQLSQSRLGWIVPMIGTEGGTPHAPAESQARWIVEAFRSLPQREPYWLAYSPWLIGNTIGGGEDPRWEPGSWFKPDHVEPVVDLVKQLP